jgi:hypothetical protein
LQIAKSLKLPLGPGADKTQVQDAIYAVEELYFFRQFDEAIELVGKLLSEASCERLGSGPERELLESYRSRCEAKNKQMSS